MKKLIIVFCFQIFLLNSFGQHEQLRGVIVDTAIVVTAHPEASNIGLQILKKGGNAFDAAVAVEFALAVCYPAADNITGGGFMVYRLSDGVTGALDYREKAPALAHRNMYLDQDGNVLSNRSTEGCLSVGVPGTVAGMIEITAEDNAFNEYVMNELMNLGYKMKNVAEIGRVEAVMVLPDGRLEGAADPRGDDKAVGY